MLARADFDAGHLTVWGVQAHRRHTSLTFAMSLDELEKDVCCALLAGL